MYYPDSVDITPPAIAHVPSLRDAEGFRRVSLQVKGHPEVDLFLLLENV